MRLAYRNVAADDNSTDPPDVPDALIEPRKVVWSSDQIIAVPPVPSEEETIMLVLLLHQ